MLTNIYTLVLSQYLSISDQRTVVGNIKSLYFSLQVTRIFQICLDFSKIVSLKRMILRSLQSLLNTLFARIHFAKENINKIEIVGSYSYNSVIHAFSCFCDSIICNSILKQNHMIRTVQVALYATLLRDKIILHPLFKQHYMKLRFEMELYEYEPSK